MICAMPGVTLTPSIKHLWLFFWCLKCHNYSFIPFFLSRFLLLQCQSLWERQPLSFTSEPYSMWACQIPSVQTESTLSQKQANHFKLTLRTQHTDALLIWDGIGKIYIQITQLPEPQPLQISEVKMLVIPESTSILKIFFKKRIYICPKHTTSSLIFAWPEASFQYFPLISIIAFTLLTIYYYY